jgi:hypothetical protein
VCSRIKSQIPSVSVSVSASLFSPLFHSFLPYHLSISRPSPGYLCTPFSPTVTLTYSPRIDLPSLKPPQVSQYIMKDPLWLREGSQSSCRDFLSTPKLKRAQNLMGPSERHFSGPSSSHSPPDLPPPVSRHYSPQENSRDRHWNIYWPF